MPKTEHIGLTSRQVQNFIDDGFVKVENAFSTDLAKQCREELWVDIGLSPDKPDNWIQPVVRVGTKTSPPFIEAANTPRLHRAYDELAGNGRWLVPKALGTFPIRFPSPQFPADLGWCGCGEMSGRMDGLQSTMVRALMLYSHRDCPERF
jgi:hypothetical protein